MFHSVSKHSPRPPAEWSLEQNGLFQLAKILPRLGLISPGYPKVLRHRPVSNMLESGDEDATGASAARCPPPEQAVEGALRLCELPAHGKESSP